MGRIKEEQAGDLLKKIALFISYYFSKKLTRLSLDQKNLRKHLLMKGNIKNQTKISATLDKK